MARIAKYSDNSFIDGAIDIAAQYGIACVSMSAISRPARRRRAAGLVPRQTGVRQVLAAMRRLPGFWRAVDAGPAGAQVKAEQAALDACFLRCAQAGQDSGLPILPALRFLLLDAPIAIVKPYLMQNQPLPLCAEAILRASHDAVCAWAAKRTAQPN